MKTTKEMIEVMQACERGEQIEFCYTDEVIKVWQDTNGKPLWNWGDTDYRVKPKPKYVPFETAEEFITAQRKKGRFIIDKKSGTKYNIFINASNIVYLTNIYSFSFFGTLQKIFDEFTFTDGTPCGKEVDV